MAEVLGIIAGGMSIGQLAGQILVTSIKIKQLFDKIKDGPEVISELIERIKFMVSYLGDFDNDSLLSGLPLMSPTYARLMATRQQCQHTLLEMQAIVDDLNSKLQDSRRSKRRLAAVKVVLKAGILAKYERRLSHAVQLLGLAQQSYMM